MAKVIVVCGKICSGKSYYADSLKEEYNAVIISPDEATYDLIDNKQGDFYEEFSEKLIKYLEKKIVEIVKAGANVIFERGLWTSKSRIKIKKFFEENDVECEIHYVCVDDETWKLNIEERNKKILERNGGSDFYIDEGLMNKFLSRWEEPAIGEVDILYQVKRNNK